MGRTVPRSDGGRAPPCQHGAVIVVLGEALVDLAVHADGTMVATPGGAPFNVARACGRLGADVAFGASISTDQYGRGLVELLYADGVDVSMVLRTDRPTTLAHAELDTSGVARWRFDTDGTSAPEVTAIELPVETDVVFTGGLALVLEPMATTIDGTIRTMPAGAMLMVDLNCRPAVIADRRRYTERLERIASRADVVKASDEDLGYLYPDLDVDEAARQLVKTGSGLVLVTAGAGATRIIERGEERLVEVQPVAVVDTIGAGDAFAAGFVTWWVMSGRGRDELVGLDAVADAVRAGHVVASIVVGHRGADPPWAAELPPTWLPDVTQL